jgi:hypothetical protein
VPAIAITARIRLTANADRHENTSSSAPVHSRPSTVRYNIKQLQTIVSKCLLDPEDPVTVDHLNQLSIGQRPDSFPGRRDADTVNIRKLLHRRELLAADPLPRFDAPAEIGTNPLGSVPGITRHDPDGRRLVIM